MATGFAKHLMAVTSAAAALDAALTAAADAVLGGEYTVPDLETPQLTLAQMRIVDDIEIMRYNTIAYSLPRVAENLAWLGRVTQPTPDAALGYEEIAAPAEASAAERAQEVQR